MHVYDLVSHLSLSHTHVFCSGSTVNKNNSANLPSDWSCGANKKGSMTVDLFMSLCVHHVENNLKPKGYGAGKKASLLIFDGHASRWSYAGLMFLMANNCWPFCLASHTSSWAQVGVRLCIVYRYDVSIRYSHNTHLCYALFAGGRLRGQRHVEGRARQRGGLVACAVRGSHCVYTQ